MPYKFETKKLRIRPEDDRRIKIPKSEHLVIFALHKAGMAIRAIARRYGVDHRLIQFILYPERHALNYAQRLDRGGSKQYYNKDKWRVAMREHRAYRRKLNEKGRLVESGEVNL